MNPIQTIQVNKDAEGNTQSVHINTDPDFPLTYKRSSIAEAVALLTEPPLPPNHKRIRVEIVLDTSDDDVRIKSVVCNGLPVALAPAPVYMDGDFYPLHAEVATNYMGTMQLGLEVSYL